MNIDEQAAADAIMSARHSDAFDFEACVKILRDNLSGGESRSDSASSGVIGIGTHSESASEKVTNSPPAQFSQPKPESWPRKAAEPPRGWQEIAREAWKDVTDLADTLEEGICDLQGDTRFIAIVLSAIERSHAPQPQPSKASPLGERSEHDFKPSNAGGCCDICGKCKADHNISSGHPPSSAKATDDWRIQDGPDGGYDLYTADNHWVCSDQRKEKLERIRDAHKAELAAERKSREQIERLSNQLYVALREGKPIPLGFRLCDEVQHILNKIQRLTEQFLSALAAIEKAKAHICNCPLHETVFENVDLYALREHDAEMRKPLMDALKRVRNLARVKWIYQVVDDALAKVKR